MPGGKTKFHEKWLENLDGNGDIVGSWCKRGENENRVTCLLCKCSISISNGGILQIFQHASSKKHCKATRLLKTQRTLVPSQSNDVANSTQGSSASPNSLNLSVALTFEQTVTRAEALWAMKVAISNFSFEACKDIVQLFELMFEGHPVGNRMQISERKVSYVLSHGLGPYFYSETISDIKSALNVGCFFTLCFDETTTLQTKKQLDIYIRYWSPRADKITTSYLTSLFLGHAFADTISQKILETLKADDLPLDKLLMIGMDGPNVNLSVLKKLNEEIIKLGFRKLIDVDTCTLHKVHNSFSKALDGLPLNIDEFASDLFAFFKQSAARREDLKNLQKLLDCDEKFLLRHVNSRWLTLGPVVTRILKVYKSLEEYFLKFLPKQKNSWNSLQGNARYKRIVNTLKNPETVVYLEFTAALTPQLESYLTLFQTEGPLIHILFSEINKLYRNILLKFIKEDVISELEGNKLEEIDLDNFDNYKDLKDFDIGTGTKIALSCIKENKVKEVKMALRSCVIKLAKYLKKSLPLANSLLRDLQILHPCMRNEVQNSAIQRLCLHMKTLNLTNETIDNIISEWQLYRLDKTIQELVTYNLRIDVFWQKVFDVKEPISGRLKYKNLAILVKNCLALSHGNSDVERGFSLNNNLLTRNRLNMSEATIIGIRQVKDSVRRFGSMFDVPLTGKLLNSVTKSYSAYAAEKEALARTEEEIKKKRKLEEEEREKKKKQKQLEEEQAKQNKARVNFLQNELGSANKCLAGNNERLQEAVRKNDYVSVRILSAAIESTTNEIKRITSDLCEIQK